MKLNRIFKHKGTLIIFGVACTLLSCNNNQQQPQGLTQADVVRMLDSVKTAAKEEAKEEAKNELKAEYEKQAKENEEASTSSMDYSSSDMSLEETAYKGGYDKGMLHHANRLIYFQEDDEKMLKDLYMRYCRYNFGQENYSNRTLYNEFRRGFYKGFEDGNNAL